MLAMTRNCDLSWQKQLNHTKYTCEQKAKLEAQGISIEALVFIDFFDGLLILA